MLKERIQDYFNKYPKLQVLFFFDPEGDYFQEVKALDIPEIHIEYYNHTPFTTKYRLVCELKTKKVFLYLPMAAPQSQPEYHKFPLMGLWLANKELQLDNVGEFMERFGLQRNQNPLVAKYISELKYSGVQKVCATILEASKISEPLLQKGLLSAFLKFKKIESWAILVAKLLVLANQEDASELNRVLKKVEALNFTEELHQRIIATIGYPIATLNQHNLLLVAQSVLYNNITQEFSKSSNDPYAPLKIEDPTQITQLNQLLFEVERHANLADDFKKLMQQMMDYIKGKTLIESYGINADYSLYTSSMIWEIVFQVRKYLQDNPKEAITQLERISLQQELDDTVNFTLKYLTYTARLHHQINAVKSCTLNRPEQYVEWYTQELFGIDKTYRQAVNQLKQIDDTEVADNINLGHIQEVVNTAYEKHTESLNREWLACLNQFKFDYKQLQIPKQYDFYKTEIAHQDQKVVVIISDALRYEVGEHLLSELHSDTKNTAEIRHMLASVPSKTSIGMAQLLPKKHTTFANGDIELEGISCNSAVNRAKILKLHHSNANAVQYADIIGLDMAELREIFKDEVVYVYHDVIDATGDKKVSERRTFDVVKDALSELKQFIKRLHSSYNVAKVFITADHGFLYNEREIQEKEKEQLPKLDFVQSHNRYFLTEESLEPELGYCIPLSATTVFQENLFVTIPASTNRYKKQGVGHQFVHGGGSLQELVVPLIESSRKRVRVTKKVNPVLVHKGTLKVVSSVLRVNLLQENEVSRYEKERTIKLGLYKDGNLVSNEEEVALNATSESPSERMTRIELTLANTASAETMLKLKIFDIEDTLNAILEERVQNNTLIQPDF